MSIWKKIIYKFQYVTYADLISIKYNVSNQKLYIKCPKSFEDRSIKTSMMFMQAFEIAKPKIKKSFKVNISIDDYYDKKRTVFAYSKDKKNKNIILIPDFCFWNWKESGMHDYEDTCHKLVGASKIRPKYNTLFWIGNVATHPTRGTLCTIAESDERIEVYGMNWKNKDGKNIPSKFVSLVDHTQYKYLIDVQGRGYSGRIKMLLFSGRPLFIAERKWIEYWSNGIQPFVHYIPVKEDLSDLIDKLNWAESHQEEAQQIAKNAQEYAINNLNRKKVIEDFADIIVNYANP